MEEKTFRRLSQIIQDNISSDCQIAVLSGPNHAEEVGSCIPSATVVASCDENTARAVQDIFMSPYFRVYTNPDMIGVELGGALKNVIAIGAGLCEGLGYGDNTKSALVTRDWPKLPGWESPWEQRAKRLAACQEWAICL